MKRDPDFIAVTCDGKRVALTYGCPTIGYCFQRIVGYHWPDSERQEAWLRVLQTRRAPGVEIEWLL